MNSAIEVASKSAQQTIADNWTFFEEVEAILYVNTSTLTSCCTETSEPINIMRYLKALSNDQFSLLAILLLCSSATVFGNALVMWAVIRERYLHNSTNYFVTSLALADCLVGLVVMPFSAFYEVFQNTWVFGNVFCDLWRSLDVLFSTASILNLCMISLDRYWAIIDPFAYPFRMTRRRAAGLICIVWICSGAISFPAILWWRAARDGDMPPYKCIFTAHLGYLLFSSAISFYLPLLVMVFTYCRIYRAAIRQTRSLKIGTKRILKSSGELQLTLRLHRGGTTSGASTCSRTHRRTAQCNHNHGMCALYDREKMAFRKAHTCRQFRHWYEGKHFSLSRKVAKLAKEKRAAKTLGIVMGVFIVCWLPFFVVNLLSGLCMDCISNEEIVLAVVTWLGWINSGMNPIIYACWSRDFRSSVNLVLCHLV